MVTPLVQFEDVNFAYEDGPLVLQDINLEIHRGNVIAVLGPNGAGKTTLVKHAIGLLKLKLGQVCVEGIDTRQLSVAQIARTIGYVFQSPSHMLFAPTVRDELAFGPKNLGYDQAMLMDLRCFGIGKRTWLQKLGYKKADWALIAFSVAVFVSCTVVRVAFPALGHVWVPQWILNLATMR